MIWGDVAYGQAAYNLAMSLKTYSPDIPIHIVSQQETLKGVPLDYFDSVEWYHHPVTDPGLFKSQVYEKLPFRYNLYLDVDALCVAPIEPLFKRLIGEGKPYRCFVHTYYGKESEDAMPLMVWAYRKDIWSHYGLDDHQLPATQSSLQFIEKCEWSEQMFLKFQQNFSNPIPLQKLRNAWGGGQPDELYLNVTLAQLNYRPDLGDGIYFGNEFTIPRPHQIKEKHQILSMFGTVQNIKSIYVRYYDGELQNMARNFGHRTAYKWNNIAAKKHANKRMPYMGGRTRRGSIAPGAKYQPPTTFKYKDLAGTIGLFTSLYESGNPIRQAEFDKVLNENLNHPEITKIVNLGTRKVDHPKVINIDCERPTYQDFLKEARRLGFDYTIIANSDIYFDETINWIKQINIDKTMLALSRYDVDIHGAKKLFAYEWSQDTWIFKDLPESTEIGRYWLGLPGCDNKFAYDVGVCGFGVINPSRDIRTLHIHNSNIRNYGESDRLPPPYKEVPIRNLEGRLKKTLLIKQPGKVGDIISCLPIAEFYSKEWIVIWECPKEYHHLFNRVNYATPAEVASGDKVIDLSFGLNPNSPSHKEWQRVREHESFLALKFRLAGVPFTRDLKYKRDDASEQSLFDILNPKEPYALVHDSSDYGTKPQINTALKIVKFEKQNGYSIYDWRKVIEGASEIHCIDSSLCNFVDIVKPKGKLFYYKTDRVPLAGDETVLTANWEKINCLEYANG